jgi:uncharacterized integral membrane protein (TIGR00698 family)
VGVRGGWIPERADVPGVLLAGALGGASLALVRALPASPLLSDVLIALVLGAVVANVPALRRAVDLGSERWAPGLRWVGKWLLRAAIVLMGFKVQPKLFGPAELALIGGVAAASLPSTFFVAHAAGAALHVRRPTGDLVASGTMICGASAVNAVAPVVGARKEEQGIAIGTVFLFSVVALLVFRPIAAAVGLDASHAGIWSGLAVNDLSSAVAVGTQMGEPGGTMAAAAKSLRIVLLAPMLLAFAVARHEGKQPQPRGLGRTALEQLPRFLIGYVALAVARVVGDRMLGGPGASSAASGAWAAAVAVDRWAVDIAMVTVTASIGLHLELRKLLASGARALIVGGASSAWMAALTLAMVAFGARGQAAAAALVGVVALLVSAAAYRTMTGKERVRRELRARFDAGAPLSLSEATRLLGALEGEGPLEDAVLRKTMTQIHPASGELVPVRESPLHHGEGCRWITYWEGASGWALVAVCRDPGSSTPIHAHPHRLIGKSIEGMVEELRFAERGEGALEVLGRKLLAHNDLVETAGLEAPHLVRAVGDVAAIDLQLRGPEVGVPGKRFRTPAFDVGALRAGDRLEVIAEVDDRPGQGGEGARAGRLAGAPPLLA